MAERNNLSFFATPNRNPQDFKLRRCYPPVLLQAGKELGVSGTFDVREFRRPATRLNLCVARRSHLVLISMF